MNYIHSRLYRNPLFEPGVKMMVKLPEYLSYDATERSVLRVNDISSSKTARQLIALTGQNYIHVFELVTVVSKILPVLFSQMQCIIIIFLPSVSRIPRGLQKKLEENCRSDHYSRQSSNTKESYSSTPLNRCTSTETRWNKKSCLSLVAGVMTNFLGQK